MRSYMFKNRWGALFFVCLTAFGAVNLIGGEDDEGLLLSATGELTETQIGADIQDNSASQTPSSNEIVISEYVSDSDLIDDAQGFDPTPALDPAKELSKVEEEGDMIILIDDDQLNRAAN